jgi:hypothetical protein
MNKHQGVTQCTPSASDVTSWDDRLSALEGMMAQVIAAMTKNNALQIVAEMTSNQEEVRIDQSVPTETPLLNLRQHFKTTTTMLKWRNPNQVHVTFLTFLYVDRNAI